jgi:hypothetical protein
VPAFIAQGDQLGACEDETTRNDGSVNNENKFQAGPLLYPNPANNSASVSLTLANDAQVNITVVDVQGKTVIKPVNKNFKAGNQLFDINTSGLGNGLYFVQLSYNNTTSKIKLVVLH